MIIIFLFAAQEKTKQNERIRMIEIQYKEHILENKTLNWSCIMWKSRKIMTKLFTHQMISERQEEMHREKQSEIARESNQSHCKMRRWWIYTSHTCLPFKTTSTILNTIKNCSLVEKRRMSMRCDAISDGTTVD